MVILVILFKNIEMLACIKTFVKQISFELGMYVVTMIRLLLLAPLEIQFDTLLNDLDLHSQSQKHQEAQTYETEANISCK